MRTIIKKIKTILVLITILVQFICAKSLASEPMMEFLPYCTYGVITGALMGGASLALSEDPTSNMNAIARGASLGLYFGAAVGAFKYYEGKQRRSRIEYMVVPESKRFSALINYNF